MSADPMVSERQVQDELRRLDPEQVPGVRYIPRCWIHTHPRWLAFMSHVDILNLYNMRSYQHPNLTCGIVFSPKTAGVKALCVELTKRGMQRVNFFTKTSHYPSQVMQGSKDLFYQQIPFTTSNEPCYVVDFRSRKEVTQQLTAFVTGGNSDDWTPPNLYE